MIGPPWAIDLQTFPRDKPDALHGFSNLWDEKHAAVG